MPPVIASIVYGIAIIGLFVLYRRGGPRASIALWIPTIWLFFSSSRPLTGWLGLDTAPSQALAYSEGNPVDRAAFLVLEAAALIVVLKRGRKLAPVLSRNLPIGMFFLYAAFSIAWSDSPFVTFKHWIKGVGDVLMVLIVLSEPNVTEAIRRLVTRLGFVLVPWSVLLIRYYPSMGRAYSVGGTAEPCGVTTQKNSLGGLCAILGIALLWCFREAYNERKNSKRIRRLVALGTVLAMTVWLLYLSSSVTSICTVSIAVIVMLLSDHPAFRRRSGYVHVLTAGVIICTIYALFFQSSGALIQGLGRNPTLTGRTDIWHAVLSIPNNRLLGVGYESFWVDPRLGEVQEILHVTLNESHNGYLEIFLTLGSIGLILLGLLIGIGYKNIFIAYRRDPDIGSFRIAWFLAVVITALTEAVFRMMGLSWIVFLLATANSRWDAGLNVRSRGRSGIVNPRSLQERGAHQSARVSCQIVEPCVSE